MSGHQIEKYEIRDANDQPIGLELYETLDEARAAVPDAPWAIIAVVYAYDDSELIETSTGANHWPPKPGELEEEDDQEQDEDTTEEEETGAPEGPEEEEEEEEEKASYYGSQAHQGDVPHPGIGSIDQWSSAERFAEEDR